MDPLTNYHGFKEDIETVFKDLISEFDLKLIEPSEGLFLLRGEKCDLKFTYDRGDLVCSFKQPGDYIFNPGYQVWPVYRYLYPVKETAVKFTNGDWGTPKQQLSGYSKVIQDHLKNILEGDFSWLVDYSMKVNEESRLTMFVFSLDRNHPISKKFWSGDNSWKVDAENYLKQTNSKPQETNRGWFRKLWS